jgi:hypothetical protein
LGLVRIFGPMIATLRRPLRVLAPLALLTLVSCDDRGSGLTGVTPGLPASQLVILSQPSDEAVSTNITPAIQVAVRNSAGQTITTSTAAITVQITPATGTPGAILNGTLTQVATQGVALFNNLSINTAGTGYTLTFSALGLNSAVSQAFSITP